MRVRPVFWLILVFVCAGVLSFAALVQPHEPAQMRIHLERFPTSGAFTLLDISATDMQGIPIEGAQILPTAKMTNMDMTTNATYTTTRGEGGYTIHVCLYMAGPWAITISMQAPGFDPLRQTLFVRVQPQNGNPSCMHPVAPRST